MRVEVDEGHSSIPSVPNDPVTESGIERIEGDGEFLASLLATLFLDRASIEQHALLGVSGEASHAQRHRSESNPPTHTLLKDGQHHGRQITFPAGLRSDALMFGYLKMIAVPDREGQTATDASLTPQCPTEPLQRIEQSTGQHGIIDFIRIEKNCLFETGLNLRR